MNEPLPTADHVRIGHEPRYLPAEYGQCTRPTTDLIDMAESVVRHHEEVTVNRDNVL